MSEYIGVDLGGTHLRAARVDLQTGRLTGLLKIDTQANRGPEVVLERLVGLVQRVIAESGIPSSEINGVGIGIPGLVDLERGRALLLPNIPGNWKEIPFAAIVSQGVGLPVSLLNDVRSMTLGEWTFGAGKGVDTMACYAVGTGIGGGVIVNGKLHLGLSGSAGELGHQVVEADGLPCNCGGRGCLEMYAAGPAITAQAASALLQRRPTLVSELAGGDLNRINVELVLQAARQGDPLAVSIFERAGRYIGLAVANTLHTLAPRKVVFGGGVSAAGDLLLEPVRRTVKERVFLVPASQVEILPAELGDNGGLIGAALWAKLSDRLDTPP